jgi:alpha-L-fucosidase
MLTALLAAAAIAAPQQSNPDIEWWREARFGMFIHWGLYAVPAGEWGERKTHGEWILNTGQIPVKTYEKFAGDFNPVKFDADAWAKMAKAAGMKYLVITTKHHDGFALWPSKTSDWDIERTPYDKDIMKDIAEACRANDIRIGWYHSIMDWHHEDYLPRRGWEDRSAEGADYERYRQYLHSQVTELLTEYGKIDVIWFDGEWEATWKTRFGEELFALCTKLQPQILVNNRVGAGRTSGHFGTPEQRIPETGLPGQDWETCMTMGRTWGYNKNDQNWKSSKTLIQNLADIASKGGNYLLNVGPKADGEFPQLAVDTLAEIGDWMDLNGEAIHGTTASPVGKPDWGRITSKGDDLYLIVFNWPDEGIIEIPKLGNDIQSVEILGSGEVNFIAQRRGPNLMLSVPQPTLNETASVIKLDLGGAPIAYLDPVIKTETEQFIGFTDVVIEAASDEVVLHYTTDGSPPTSASPKYVGPFKIIETSTVKTAGFHRSRRVTETVERLCEKAVPMQALSPANAMIGLRRKVYLGEWSELPDFDSLTEHSNEKVANLLLDESRYSEDFGAVIEGVIRIPETGVYQFELTSDDGSKLLINGQVIVDHDGIHSASAKSGEAALAKGRHIIRVEYFNGKGNFSLNLKWRRAGEEFTKVPDSAFR